jgi:hypothetical protein
MDLSKPIHNSPTFHLELKEFRKQCGFNTVAAMAEASGIPAASIYSWEKPFSRDNVNGTQSNMARPGPKYRQKLLEFAEARGWTHEDLLNLSASFKKKSAPAKAAHPHPHPGLAINETLPQTFTLMQASVTVVAENLELMSKADRDGLIALLDQVIRNNATAIAQASQIRSQVEALR